MRYSTQEAFEKYRDNIYAIAFNHFRNRQDAEELHDNRRVDVRGDRQSEQSTVVERVTGHHNEVVEEGAALLNATVSR